MVAIAVGVSLGLLAGWSYGSLLLCLCRRMVMETIDKVISNLGAADIDARLEELLVDGILYAFQEQVGCGAVDICKAAPCCDGAGLAMHCSEAGGGLVNTCGDGLVFAAMCVQRVNECGVFMSEGPGD